MRLTQSAVSIALALAAPSVLAATLPRFRMQVLGPPPLNEAIGPAAVDMNNHGEVVGHGHFRYAPEQEQHALYWRGGKASFLKRPLEKEEAGQNPFEVAGFGINDRGSIVGKAYAPYDQGLGRALMWPSSNAVPQSLPPTPHLYDVATEINNRGTIAGQSERDPFVHTAPVSTFLWRHGRALTLWNDTDGDPHNLVRYKGAKVTDLNENDEVVGTVRVPQKEDPYRPYWISRNQAMYWGGDAAVQLRSGIDGWEFTNANAINDAGVIVGAAADIGPDDFFATATRAVTWKDGVMSFLPGTQAAEASAAFDINEHGWIVGDIAGDAVLWMDNRAASLESLVDSPGGRWDLQAATVVNEAGQILVSGLTEDGLVGYAVLTQVPEPGSVVLALTGLGMVGAGCRQRSHRPKDGRHPSMPGSSRARRAPFIVLDL
ncbi:PEP-CTERM sorting domain-containing protein [Aquabacterium sp. A7-Y]|uniref:PEP-CTERM sorting domain-containing protein n=1 Tax=Aquabacterium sp. A7-Y TaxID=1349605 RepID=UPI00223DFAA1|nr:PEP-CTERM sorting domain-containing protein [Aquabacterium sp. A7-Y]MCW7539670.1 PEP-CTERM sorting domain-containing protein [Aquabacterium sp. A7-Y]